MTVPGRSAPARAFALLLCLTTPALTSSCDGDIGQPATGGGTAAGGGASGEIPIPTDEACAQDGSAETCYPGSPSTRGIGACSDGHRLCMVLFWSQCLETVVPTEEACGDGVDDDCDGRTDEGCACDQGASLACYTGAAISHGIGVCHGGQQDCDGGQWSNACDGEVTPSAELCNGEDDDCNGLADDCDAEVGCANCETGDLCEAGSCVSYAWVISSWGACSASCEGGTQARTVQCVREDTDVVDDSFCEPPKPPESQSCNTQSCCSTDALSSGQRCDGNAQIQWVHFNTDTGSLADQDACAQNCTSWASGQLNDWCCELYEDSGADTNWVCRVYDANSSHGQSGDWFAGLGSCQNP